MLQMAYGCDIGWTNSSEVGDAQSRSCPPLRVICCQRQGKQSYWLHMVESSHVDQPSAATCEDGVRLQKCPKLRILAIPMIFVSIQRFYRGCDDELSLFSAYRGFVTPDVLVNGLSGEAIVTMW